MHSRALLCLLLLSACTQPSGSGSAELATRQALTIPLQHDIQDLDPATMGILAPDLGIGTNLFGGLYRFDDNLKVVPDIALGPPDISADGLTYTFHLRRDARFSNGDPVRAGDFMYSWNRVEADARNGLRLAMNPGQSYPLLDVVRGSAEVRTGKSKTMPGLAAADDHTLVVSLSQRAAYWIEELALPFTWVLDEKVIRSRGEETWWTTPEGLVGTGPFRMTSRAPGKFMEFAPVDNWWGGSTGHLKRLRAEIVSDLGEQAAGYRSGKYDLVGEAEQQRFVHDEDLFPFLAAVGDEVRRGQLLTGPAFSTWMIDFNLASGPLSQTADGQRGRQALSLAVDRQQLVNAVCGKPSICTMDSGGRFLPGMTGYLGNTSARFDPREARSLLRTWDPDGSKLKGLEITTVNVPRGLTVAANVRDQWAKNLGVHAEIQVQEVSASRQWCGAPPAVSVDGFIYPFDEPHFFYRRQFVPGGACWGGYSSPGFEQLLNAADLKQQGQATDDYVRAARLLVDDAAYIGLLYSKRAMLAKPYVRGVGFNAIYDRPWSEMEVLTH